MFSYLLLFLVVLVWSTNSPVFGQGTRHNTPPTVWLDRHWEVPSDKKVGDLIVRVKARDEEGDRLTFGIEPSEHYDGSDLFFINKTTGVVYLAADLTGKEDQQYYLYVTASDGQASVKNQIWVEVVPPIGDLAEFERPPVRNSRPKLPPNLQTVRPQSATDSSAVNGLPQTGNRGTSGPPETLPLDIISPETKPPHTTTTSPVAVTSAPAVTSAGQRPEDQPMDLTPIVVPLVVVIILAPAAGCAVYYCRKQWSSRKKSLKKENYSIEFQKRSGFGSDGEKSADEASSTWRLYESKGMDATKWNLGQTNLSFTPGVSRTWEFPRHHLRILHQLGEGCFGQVWKCEALDIAGVEGVSVVAVKTLKESACEKEKKDLLQEMEVMKLLEPHPNVVTMLGCCTEKDPVFLIMEFVSRGKLQTYLRESRTPNDYNNLHGPSATLTSRDLTTFAFQVARGMHYLTEKGIIHRDLAARNVLVSEERVCKVADFGFARDVIVNHVYERKTEGRLPIRWMAPESLYDNLFTAKSDVWSFGILLWEIVTLGSTPYPGMSAQEVMKKVRDGYRLEKPEHCRRELFNLMYYCWSADSSERPGFGEIVETLEKLLLSEMDYIELDRFPEHSYYNLSGLSGEKV